MHHIRQAIVTVALSWALFDSTSAHAADKWIKDPVQISAFLHSVPAIGGDLGSRLETAGLTVAGIGFSLITKDDVVEDPEHWAMGDVQVQVLTDGEPMADDCHILGSPTFIKRHGKYLPQDRTGVLLLTGRCALPD